MNHADFQISEYAEFDLYQNSMQIAKISGFGVLWDSE